MSLWHLSMANGRWQMCFCEKVQEPPGFFFICNAVLPLLVFRPKTNIRFLYQCAIGRGSSEGERVWVNSSWRNDGPLCLALRWVAAACRNRNLGLC